VNEPCFETPTAPDPNRRGLWLDVRRKDCPADPFEDETRYPGVALGSRGKPLSDGTTQPVGSFYGYATGIMGLRLFPNPDFDAKAAKDWNPERYYTDPSYYKPGGSGAAVPRRHVLWFLPRRSQPRPSAADPNAPTFADLSSSVGAQYMWVDRLFIFNSNKPEGRKNFMYQLVKTYRPGSMDTSLISTDSINNPRTMNAVYDFVSRMGLAKNLWHEKLAGGELNNKQFNDFVSEGPLTGYYAKADTTSHTPHVLKDGADSVGLPGIESRLPQYRTVQRRVAAALQPRGRGQTDHPHRDRERGAQSPYWQATELGTFRRAVLLEGGAAGPAEGCARRERLSGRRCQDLGARQGGFCDTCARCHSSKGPPPPPALELDPDKCAGAAYLGCFKRYWSWTQSRNSNAKCGPSSRRRIF